MFSRPEGWARVEVPIFTTIRLFPWEGSFGEPKAGSARRYFFGSFYRFLMYWMERGLSTPEGEENNGNRSWDTTVSQLLLYKEGGGSQPRQMPRSRSRGGLGGLPANPVPVHLTRREGEPPGTARPRPGPGKPGRWECPGRPAPGRPRRWWTGRLSHPRTALAPRAMASATWGETAPYWSSSV